MSYDSYPPLPASDVDLPPSSRYNPFEFKNSTAKVDNNRFEYYMEVPKITAPEIIGLEYPRRIVDMANEGHLYFAFEEFYSDEDVGFWDEWIIDELDRETSKELDGAWTFANHLTWIRFRNGLPGIRREHMFIAYITTDETRRHTSDIVIAVCVFVQPGGIYNVSGITKSLDYTNDAAFRGVSFKLQKYIARVVKTKIDRETKGLLFRPNRVMRDIVLTKIPKVVAGDAVPESGLMGCFVGSNWDMWWQQNRRNPPRRYDYVSDRKPSILQTHQGISFRILNIDKTFNDYVDAGFGAPIPVPFWEPPSPYPNPDSPNNPQLPLMFIPIDSLVR